MQTTIGHTHNVYEIRSSHGSTAMMTNATTTSAEVAKGSSLLTEKLIVTATMIVVTFLFGIMPLKLFSAVRDTNDAAARSRWRKVISFASCFAGGVFIGACLLDLVPDVEENVSEVLAQIKMEYDVDIDYPVAQFIVVLGFFLILTIEQTVLHFQEGWMEEAERQPLISRSRQGSESNVGYQTVTPIRQDSITGLSNEVHHSLDGHADHSHINHGVFQHSTLRSVILLLALSFHSVFEGLALGLQDTNSTLISLFLGVIVHKAVMAFSLGLNIAASDLSRKSFVWSNVLFSLASPVGILIGIAIADLPDSLASNICNGVLQGLAGGTFLYITFFEVLPHEINVPQNRLWKVLFVFLGFAFICGILLFAEE